MPDSVLTWHHTDEGALASAARQPWVWVGTAARGLESDGEEIVAVTELGYYRRRLVPTDVVGGPNRARDRVELQFRFRGLSQTPGWGSGAAPNVAFVDDGARALGLSIGTTLRLIDPYTGDIVAEGAAWAFTQGRFLHFIKLRSTSWQVWVDGSKLLELPYDAAPAGVADPGIAGWGHLDAAGSSVARWDAVELGVNADLVPEWKLDRWRDTLPSPIVTRYNGRWRAMLKAGLGEAQQLLNALQELRDLITAGRRSQIRLAYSGRVDPESEEPPWSYFGLPADLEIVRGRLRFKAGSIVLGYHEVPSGLSGLDPEAEWRASARFIVRSAVTSDTAGRAGPFLLLDNGDQRVAAELFQDLANPERWYWALTEGAFTGLSDKVTGLEWQVDPFQAHHVELQVLGQTRVLLLVNGHIVDDAPYGLWTAGTTLPYIRVGRNSVAGVISCECDVTDGVAEVRYADLRRRPLFLQRLVERLIFVGGCERNDRLDTWGRHHHEVQALRGTTRGILLEIRRLACDDDAQIVAEATPATWYLGVTFPQVTPIFLNAIGSFVDAHVEFAAGAPNFTPQQLADLAVRYILPRSTLEMQFFMDLATELTAPTVDATTTTFTVADVAGFAVGDAVELRDAANVVRAEGTILDLDALTGDVETTLLGASFIAGDVMRMTLATS